MTTSITIKDGSTNVVDFTDSSIKIESEAITLTNGIIRLPIPLSPNSGTTRGINILGKQRVINLDGFVLGTEAQMASFINAIEGWVNSGTQSTRKYTQSVAGVNASYDNFSVLCDAFKRSRTNQEPNKMDWSLTMGEGGVTS